MGTSEDSITRGRERFTIVTLNRQTNCYTGDSRFPWRIVSAAGGFGVVHAAQGFVHAFGIGKIRFVMESLEPRLRWWNRFPITLCAGRPGGALTKGKA